MGALESITREEAKARLQIAYRRSSDGTFVDTLRRPLLNPVEQRDEKGKRRANPLLVVGMVLLALAGATMAFFTFHL